MSDNHKRYNAIKRGLEQLYGTKVEGHLQHNLHTLALLVNGIIGAGSVQLPKLGLKAPLATRVESRTAKLSRFIHNEKITEQLYWLPFVTQLLKALSKNGKGLTLVIDGSAVGRDCVGLFIGVVYAGRALPLAWLVIQGKKGHFCQERHLELVNQVASLVPPEVAITFLGDGEFDGALLQEQLAQLNWRYVVRTAKNTQLYIRLEARWTNYQAQDLDKGQTWFLRGVGFSSENYGELLAIGHWQASFDEPLYLISNLAQPYQALDLYKTRYRIETIFSDYKSRGFGLESSHLACPKRLSRLLIACALAYWWLTYLGVRAQQMEWDKIIQRADRCDLSMFQLGWRFMEELLNRGRPIPVALLKLPASHHF